jgi:predicted nucleic acid-binding protein
MPGFWDANALVPLCVPVENPGPSRRLLREYIPVVWWGTGVEVVSALYRRRREKLLSAQYLEVANRRRDFAEVCLERHELRAADAFQLASALVWCNERPKNRSFLCRDLRLRAAARTEGFSIVEL